MTLAQRTLSDTQFEQLRRLIYDQSGIWFADNKRYVLETRLSRRLEQLGMEHFGQYVQLLRLSPWGSDEFQEMFNRITINETVFFRNAPQLKVFEDRVLPDLLEKRRHSKRLRIWSAACSSGEEAYTLAILVHRTLGVRMMDWHIEILGTDLSERVLLQAHEGWYSSYATRGADELTLRTYFRPENNGHRINDDLKQMVDFERLNLKDRWAARRHGKFDVIFLRNVLIYFDKQMANAVIQLAHEMLAPGGTLFVGHSETVKDPARFEPRAEPEAFAYSPV